MTTALIVFLNVFLIAFVLVTVLGTLAWGILSDRSITASTFALSGFSGWAMAKPANTHHLRIGAGGFGIDFPSFLVPHLNRTGEDG